uniref:Uncharacterized protein n=1 Tax=Odontella aurita TaxID=265563 RepID=A0A7S4JQ65_9STRA|mmetsp:Transcript_5150/g.14822  ORF Transcript_5150/g.14822 Transcript_5150/m.14822 type:complete len:461 (+) Transcript_5150:194-1576(+)
MTNKKKKARNAVSVLWTALLPSFVLAFISLYISIAGDAATDNTGSVSDLPVRLIDSDKGPYQELERFLAENPDLPASRFVDLLKKHLHFEPDAESQRITACLKRVNPALCFGGLRNYRVAQKELDTTEGRKSNIEEVTRVAQIGGKSSQTVYALRRYTDELAALEIPTLGTEVACLPLMLAGYASSRDEDSVVVELGPFAGLSSRCIVTGMLQQGLRENSFFAFDSFEGLANYNAIKRRAPWLARTHADFTENNTDFLFLWELAVLPVYKTAKAKKGWITKDSLNPSVLFNRTVTMISIDCAKNAQKLKSQLEGLGTIRKGTVIFLMDFEFVRSQVKQVYGCLRGRFLLPVYASWKMEHWAWIVTNDFTLNNDEFFGRCYANILANITKAVDRMEHQLQMDVEYLEGLKPRGNDKGRVSAFDAAVNRTLEHVSSHLHSQPQEYEKLVKIHPYHANGKTLL